jgi:3-oxoacyl-[acyl-carrier-protein] synthase-1
MLSRMRQGPPAAFPITAYTLCNALGLTTEEVLRSLKAGETGLRPYAGLPFEASAGALPDVLPALPEPLGAFETLQTRMLGHLLRDLAKPLAAARARWGADRVGIALGTSTAGIDESELAHAFYRRHGKLPERYDFARQHPPDAMIEVVRALTGLGGPGLVVSTACSSSAKVFGVARRWLRSGVCDAVLVGGVDTLCQVTLRGFKSLALLSPRPCRPFAADRDGISIGEGGALLLLEREGDGAARLLGVGETSDAHHMTAPHPAGLGAVAAMTEALDQAGLAAGDVDHVNAHGTATPLNDAAEGLAIAALFGDRVPVASTKAYTGHMLGAAGATEAVFSVAAIAQGWLPASLGAENLDPALPIQIVRERMERPIRVVLSNSFAFGGSNACVALGAAT